MPRPFFPILIALSAVTGMVLAAGAIVLRPPDSVATDAANQQLAAEASVRLTVERFYIAVNHGIATGDTAPLAAVLAGDYAEGGPTGATTPAGADVQKTLRTFHQIAPGLKLSAISIVVENDTAVATVAVEGGDTAILHGLRLVAPVFWGSSDIFRVSGNQVAERRFIPGAHLTIDALDQIPISPDPAGQRLLYAQHVDLAPGEAWWGEPIGGIRVLRATSGTLAVFSRDLGPEAPLPDVDPTTAHLLLEGDSMPHDGAVWVAVANQRERAASFVVLTAVRQPPRDPDIGFSPSSDDVAPPAAKPNAPDGPGVEMPTGPVIVASCRITLEPGATLAWTRGEHIAVVTVTSGRAQMHTVAPDPQNRPATYGEGGDTSTRTVLAGHVALLVPGTAATFDNPGDTPVELVLLTVLFSQDTDESGLFQRRET